MSKSGNRYIVVVKDALTKWVELYPVPNTKAETIAEVMFDEIVCRYGPPKELVSDRGHEFVNQIMEQLCQLFKIKKLTTAPYNPRCNGMVESFMKTLKDQLQAFVSKSHDDWDQFLHAVAYSYRTTINSATGVTPHLALFGREAPNLSEDWLSIFWRRQGLSEHVRGIVEALKQTWTGIGRRMIQNQEAQEKPVENPRVFKPLAVGTKVMLKTIPKLRYKDWMNKEEYELSRKLQFRYTGEYTIQEILSPVTYRILKEDGKLQTVSIRNLKPVGLNADME
jgi:hypothetical protein